MELVAEEPVCMRAVAAIRGRAASFTRRAAETLLADKAATRACSAGQRRIERRNATVKER